MVKKHLRRLHRGTIIACEILAAGALILFIAWAALLIRLSQGPLNVDFLTRQIEKSLHRQQPEFEFSVEKTVLTGGGPATPLELQMDHVRITRIDKTPVLAVTKIGIQLSRPHLIFGQIVPRAIRIYGPALRVIRQEDGRLMLNISGADAAPAPGPEPGSQTGAENAAPSQAPETPQPLPAQQDFVAALLAQMKDSGVLSLLGGLEQVSISDAALLFEDRRLQAAWRSRQASLVFTRAWHVLLVDVVANVDLDAEHAAYVRGNFRYDWRTRKPGGVVYFAALNPALAAQQSEKLKGFSGINLPLKGSVSFEMDENFTPGPGRFVIGADAGSVTLADFYPAPVPVKSLYLQGSFDIAAREALLEQLRLDLDGPRLRAQGAIRRWAAGHILSLKAILEDMPLDKLQTYWPVPLAPDPRAWVTGHLSAGIASRATLDMALLAPEGDFGNLTVQKLGGQIDFSGVKVDYFPPLLPVTKAGGKAVYDDKSFRITVNGGMLGDMALAKGKVDITDLDVAHHESLHSSIDIAASLSGPLRTALRVLDSQPLQYPKKLGLQTAEVGGNASVDVTFKFPLHKALTLPEVKVTAKARLNDVMIKDIVGGMALTGGPLDLAVDNGAMTVKGRGSLDGMAADFTWLRNFAGATDVTSKLEAKLPLEAAALTKLGVPADFKLTGSLPAEVVYTAAKDNTATLMLKGDAGPLGFTLPVTAYAKAPGVPGALELFLHLKDGRPVRVSGLALRTEEGAQLEGTLEFDQQTAALRKAVLDPLRLGETDIALKVEDAGATGYIIRVSGRQLDASPLLGGGETPNSDEEAARPVTPMTVSVEVGSLVTGKGKSLEQPKIYLRRNGWNRVEQLELDGMAGGKPVILRYLPVPKGHTLRFDAGNAGAALSALGISGDVRGGKITVSGDPDPRGGSRDLKGSVILSDFTLVNMPVLARLLNALSLPGIVELLNGKGVVFKKARADFWWADRGQPETDKNVRSIRLKNGQTAGASLGLTFEGTVDKWKNTLDISGTIIPVSDLNKLVSSIPLVGNILSGGSGAVFAATYSIKGPKDQPTVTVNPLAVLAPGILRKLFFEK